MNIATWWFAGGLLVVAAWVWWLARRQSRRRALTALALVVATAGVASGVNAYFSYLPTFGDVGEALTGQAGRPSLAAVDRPGADHPDGVVTSFRIPDRGSGFGPSDALVWLPPQYFSQPSARFPVVYLFHGSPGVPADWFQGGQAASAALAAARAGRPAIVVAPRMSRGWLDDPECVDGVTEKIDTHFVRDVVPAVDGGLRTLADRDDRVFGGMSAGGYCALQLGLTHRDLAATIIDMSGLTQPTHTDGPQALFGPDPAVVRQRLEQTSPQRYAPRLAAAPETRIWFDVGTEDAETLGPITSIVPVLAARGIDVQLHERPGAHTFHVWAPALRAALPWALAPLGAD